MINHSLTNKVKFSMCKIWFTCVGNTLRFLGRTILYVKSRSILQYKCEIQLFEINVCSKIAIIGE